MKILKFGGSSIKEPDRLKKIVKILTNTGGKIITVLSAITNTTDILCEINNLYINKQDPKNLIEKLKLIHIKYINSLFISKYYLTKAMKLLNECLDIIYSFNNKNIFCTEYEKIILAQGEIISTHLLHLYLQEIKIKSCLLPALSFMLIDKNSEPDLPHIFRSVNKLILDNKDYSLFITQGYICKNPDNQIDNLDRGSSDYTATLIGSAISSEEIQIWTDIDGLHNNDPRFIKNTRYIPEILFDEAAELAYFGAKILHPNSILPAKKSNIPIRLLSTLEPNKSGTLISSKRNSSITKAIAAKDDIIIIKIKSHKMQMAYEFLINVLIIFKKYKIPTDMINTSKITASIALESKQYVEDLKNDLQIYGEVNIKYQQSIICILGDFISGNNTLIIAKIIQAVQDIPLEMICYGSSNNTVHLVVNSNNKVLALESLHNTSFI
ncbi:aspartate kinase [Rickettsia endosymbiont of Cardiosporidium cionae]|uniref:aspartate kinase n=1 Tax=Rickettsia endosymbiont of Cardiosporidium cionae TaxID=2777155 RepID=UPI0018937374|nr:aspartate kinase [Rickettsia endosymbiont of Cardiosporidium cionae]KAF8818809.1 Lysine-sensitive aspartokinase 3 [Rickettsia endosymbiont of Cardiosporidium cionae]